MALLNPQDAGDGLAQVTFVGAQVGDAITAGTAAGGWGLGMILLARNANVGATRTVTVNGVATVIPASSQAVIPVNRIYQTPAVITYSNVADVTIAALRLTRARP